MQQLQGTRPGARASLGHTPGIPREARRNRGDPEKMFITISRSKNDQQKYGKIWYYVGFEWF